MQTAIGIISYLPNDTIIRKVRIKRFQDLLKQCGMIFPETPVYVIAQNYQKADYALLPSSVHIIHYDKALGITNARKELRKTVINNDIDYCIMFDDDCILEGTLSDGTRFIELLKNNPNKYICHNNDTFKLCALSKHVLQLNEIPDVSVQDGTGAEDMAFMRILYKKYPELQIVGYNWGALREVSIWYGDRYSTWSQSNISELLKNTQKYIKTQLEK